MTTPNSTLRGTAIAAILALPLSATATLAQESSTGETDQASGQQSSSTSAATSSSSEQKSNDSVVATVGDKEIRGSDVKAVIGLLPPRLQSQPPQMLVPMALEQLILRELILQEAQSQDLATDPEVIALVEDSAQTAEEDAMVQVWLDREMANVVTDEAVQKVYDEAKEQSEQELPPLEEVRPQIEQSLRQQAMQKVRMQLREGADIVFYDPTGQPMEQDKAGTTGSQDNSGQTADDKSSGDSTGDAASSDGGQSTND